MKNLTANQANGRNEVNDPSLESRVIKLEQQVRVMERILIMLVPSLRAEHPPSPTYESCLHLVTDPSLVMRMEALKAKQASASANDK